MSNPRYGSGKTQFIGRGVDADLTQLDPTAYEGAVAYSENQLYFSNGEDWVIPQDTVDITRPRGLAPTTDTEATQLRLSPFASPAGETQTGIIYEINADGVPDFSIGANIETRTVTSTIASLYQVLYPEDGFEPGDTIWWRARYTGTNGTQSQFSTPIAQVYPDFISDPVAVTREGAVTGFLEITPYESAFDLNYVGTDIEIYASDGVTLVEAFTSVTGASTAVPATLTEGAVYTWRARYSGRVGASGPVLTTEWTDIRSFLNGARSMILVFDPALAIARTITLPLFGTVNVTVNWGDGTSDTYTIAGARNHTYAAGVTGPVTVTISGQLTEYGVNNAFNTQQPGLIRIDNFGFSLGLTSLMGACLNAANIVYVNPSIPPQVTSLSRMFYGVVNPPDVTNLDVSNVQNMAAMFAGCTNFNQDISGWDTSSVTNMGAMFQNALAFNQPIGGWDVSNVTNMEAMFLNQAGPTRMTFNQDIGAWDVSKVTNFRFMFGASSNQNTSFNNGGSPSINNWDTSSATNMEYMFGVTQNNNVPFNQPIGDWDVSNVTNMRYMFRRALIFNQDIGAWDVSNVTDMSIMFEQAVAFNNGGSPSINNWDTSSVTNMRNMFRDVSAFNQPLNNWNTSSVTDMALMFLNTTFNQPIGSWDVSSVIDMTNMFGGSRFNQNIGAWDVSNVTNMSGMFSSSTFNNGGSDSINNWDVSSVTNTSNMFGSARSFNQPLNNWDMSSVTNMSSMFQYADAPSSFDQYIGDWDVSNVTNMAGLFFQATRPNQDLGNWELNTSVVTMTSMGMNGFDAENYSRTLIGWANNLAGRDGPYNIVFQVQATRLYNTTDYVTGERFTNAAAARAFLVGAREVVVTDASDADANTTYLYNGTTLAYEASNDWYFVIAGTSWALYDDTDTLQATGTGTAPGTGPHTATAWDGVLSAATVLRTGAGWTITGDAAA